VHKIVVLAALLTLGLGAGAVGAQQPGLRQTSQNLFTTPRPHSPTGLVVRTVYFNPTDPNGKPPAVRRIVTTFQPGTRFDTSVPAQCDVPRALAGSCPPESKIGGGTITVDTGFPEPNRFLVNDTELVNMKDGFIFVTTDRKTGAKQANPASIQGRTITASVPPLPGTPPDGGALLTIRLTVNAITSGSGRNRRSFLTTPPTCPRSRRWTNRATFTYADGVTQTVGATMPCARAARARQHRRRQHRSGPRFAG